MVLHKLQIPRPMDTAIGKKDPLHFLHPLESGRRLMRLRAELMSVPDPYAPKHGYRRH